MHTAKAKNWMSEHYKKYQSTDTHALHTLSEHFLVTTCVQVYMFVCLHHFEIEAIMYTNNFHWIRSIFVDDNALTRFIFYSRILYQIMEKMTNHLSTTEYKKHIFVIMHTLFSLSHCYHLTHIYIYTGYIMINAWRESKKSEQRKQHTIHIYLHAIVLLLYRRRRRRGRRRREKIIAVMEPYFRIINNEDDQVTTFLSSFCCCCCCCFYRCCLLFVLVLCLGFIPSNHLTIISNFLFVLSFKMWMFGDKKCMQRQYCYGNSPISCPIVRVLLLHFLRTNQKWAELCKLYIFNECI